MNDAFMASLAVSLSALQDCLALLAVLFIGSFFYNLTVNKGSEHVQGNSALGITRAGFLLGLGLAASGGLFTAPDGPAKPIMIGIIGLVSMILLKISLIINDKLVLPYIDNMEEIVIRRNICVAFVEMGGCIATGLMINGAMSGKADSLAEKLAFGTAYWAVGQVLLVLAAKMFYLIAGYDVRKLIESQNLAAGLSFGGFLAATGIIIDAAMYGVSTDLASEAITIMVFVFIGMSLLVLANKGLSKILLPGKKMGTEIEAGNLSAATLFTAGSIVIALLFFASISPATLFATTASQTYDLADDESIPETPPAIPKNVVPADQPAQEPTK